MKRCLKRSKRVESVALMLMGSVLSAAIAALTAATAIAETRTLEVVGTIPIGAQGSSTVVPRDAAIEQALREAVVRVAEEFLADRPIELPSADDLNRRMIDGESPDLLRLPGGESDAEPEPPDLDAVLGKKMVPYTQRFRMIEDRGRRPALFADDPEVSEEYVVIVEVQVDVERVRSKLVEAGLIRASEAAVGSNEVRLEVDGLTVYPAYLAVRELLMGALGATGVYPVEMTRGRTVLDVQTEASAVEFLEKLLAEAPPELKIVPLHVSGNRVHVIAKWTPPPDEGIGADGEPASGPPGRSRAID